MQQWSHCPKCYAVVPFEAKYCGNCGTQLNWSNQQQSPPPQYRQPTQLHDGKQPNMRIITGILLVAIIAVVVGFAPIMEAPLTYEAQSYVKKAHRATIDPRFILSPFAFSNDIDKIQEALKMAYPPGGTADEYYPIGHVSVRNTDKIQGTFKVELIFRSGDKEYAEEFTLELKPGQVEEVEKEGDVHYDKDKWTWEYGVTPGTKKVPIFEYLLSRF